MAEKKVTKRLTTIVSVDVAGYSRLMEADEAGTLAALKAHRSVTDAKIEEYGGRIVGTAGDGLLIEFPSVSDAVSSALEAQLLMAERNADVPADKRMEFRMGINLGDVMIEGDDIFGTGVNVAARLQEIADSGGICVSRSVFNQVKAMGEIGFADLGPQKVKNIAEPVPAYKVLLDPAQAGKLLPAQRMAPKRLWWAANTAAALLVLAAAGLVWWSPWAPKVAPEQTGKTAVPLPKKPSIAVLAFTNMSGDKAQQYFADGIAEDLITDLSKISELFVIARNSSFAYQGRSVDVRQIGRELGVRYVVEGSVRKAGGKVRINAQLIDATTGRHLWAERYDGELKEVFAFQDRVTRQIVKALALHLGTGTVVRASRSETQNATAYDAFLKGWSHYQRGSAQDLRRAISLFERAVDLDPNYARARAALALAQWRAGKLYWISRSGRSGQAEERLRLALQRPTAQAYYLASWMALERGRHEAAIENARRALAIEPNSAESHVAMANALVFSGDPKGAITYIRRAMRLDPHYPANYLRILGLAEFGLDRFKEAATHLEGALKRNPKDKYPAAALAAAYGHLGRTREAAEAFNVYQSQIESFSVTGHNPVSVMRLWPFREPSDAERFGIGLLKAGVCCRSDLDSLTATLRARKAKTPK